LIELLQQLLRLMLFITRLLYMSMTEGCYEPLINCSSPWSMWRWRIDFTYLGHIVWFYADVIHLSGESQRSICVAYNGNECTWMANHDCWMYWSNYSGWSATGVCHHFQHHYWGKIFALWQGLKSFSLFKSLTSTLCQIACMSILWATYTTITNKVRVLGLANFFEVFISGNSLDGN